MAIPATTIKTPSPTPPAVFSPAALARTLAPAAAATPNQAAATATAKTQSSLDQYTNYLNTNMGRVTAQANAEYAGIVNPIISGAEQQQKQGAQAIGQYTNQLAGALGNITPQIQQAYSTAEQQQSALDTAIQAELQGNGSAQASALQQTLGMAGQDTSPAAQAAANAQGVAGASYATGSASLSSLLSQGAASTAYGATLPGIAALAGYQALGTLNNNISQTEQAALQTAAAKYPDIVNQLTGQAITQAKDQATTAETAAKDRAAAVVNTQNAATRKAVALTGLAKTQKPTIHSFGNGGLLAIGNDGKIQVIEPSGPGPITKWQGPDGSEWAIDPSTGAPKELTSGAARSPFRSRQSGRGTGTPS